MTTKALPKRRTWTDLELSLTFGPVSTLEDCERLDPDDGGWGFVPLRLCSFGFYGRTETGRLLGLLLDYEGQSPETCDEYLALIRSGTVRRLTNLIDCYLIPKGRRA